MMYRLLVTALALTASPLAAQATRDMSYTEVEAARDRLSKTVGARYPALEAIYKDIHAHPELGFQEHRTAALLAKEMRKLGFTVTEHVGKTGLVAIYSNGSGPTVLVRTELDGLPMEERTGLAYASKARQEFDGELRPVAHACGHDIHMSWWLGAAAALVADKDHWQGTLMFIAQPSEETVGGAQAMLDDGLFRRWTKPDFGFAAHVNPLPAGTIIVKPGAVSSSADRVDITFKGQGAHGSMPDKSIDPVVMASRFVTDLQSVVAREKDPAAFGVVTVGSFQSGTVDNIIPDQAKLKLTIRSHTASVRTLLLDGIDRVAKGAAAMSRAPAPEIVHVAGTSAVLNDTTLTEATGRLLKAAFGNAVTLQSASAAPSPASEDFSAFIDAGVPSTFLAIGGLDPALIKSMTAEGTPIPVNHSPLFAPTPDPTIRRGAEALALSVEAVAPKR